MTTKIARSALSGTLRKPRFLVLEPRLVFDAAAGATVVDAVSESTNSIETPERAGIEGTLDSGPAATAREVAFIDANVDDAAALAAGMRDGVEVVMLDAARDGVAQISEWLAERGGVDAIHIFSHGAAGALSLGSTELSASNIGEYSNWLATWRDFINPNADILIYGCDVASGDGQNLIEMLSLYTGADISASLDSTGASSLGGNWVLESSAGTIESGVALSLETQSSYLGLLAAPVKPPSLSISGGGAVNEGSEISFTVKLSAAMSIPQTVSYSVSGVANADDFDTAMSGVVTFAAGETSKTITLKAKTDNVYEASEAFAVTLASPVGGATLDTRSSSASGSITNTTAAPVISISGGGAVSEGGDIAFTVTMDRAASMAQTVNYSVAGAAGSADFDTAMSGVVTFEAGETWKTITLKAKTDAIYEASEAFAVTLASPVGGATLGASKVANGEITNTTAAPVISISGGGAVSEGGDITFTVTMDRAASMAQTVNYSVSGVADADDFLTSGAQAGAPLSGLVTFAAGETWKTITLKAKTDAIYEASEAFAVTLASPTGGATLGTNVVNGSITNTTAAPVISISGGGAVSEGGDITFTVTMDRAASMAQTVNYSVSGVANADDFDTAMSGVVTFAAGETSKTITLKARADGVYEGSEVAAITFDSPTGGAVFDSQGKPTGDGVFSAGDKVVKELKIVDTDVPQLTVGAALGVQGGDFFLNLNTDIRSGSDIEVYYVIAFDRTASVDDVTFIESLDLAAINRDGSNTTVDSPDFFGYRGKATIAAGQEFVRIDLGEIPVDGDMAEFFSVFLVDASFETSLYDDKGKITAPKIDRAVDFQREGAGGFVGFLSSRPVEYVISPLSFLEDLELSRFTITRYGDFAERTFDWEVLLSGTGDQYANAEDFFGFNYTGAPPSGTVTFAAGSGVATVDVPIWKDGFFEYDELFTLKLSRADYDAGTSSTAPLQQGTTNPSASGKGELSLDFNWYDDLEGADRVLKLYFDYQKATFSNDGLVDEADLVLARERVNLDVAVKLYVNGIEFDVVVPGSGGWGYESDYTFALQGQQRGEGIFSQTVDFSSIRLSSDPSQSLNDVFGASYKPTWGDAWVVKFVDVTNGNRDFDLRGGGINNKDAGPSDNGSWQARYARVSLGLPGQSTSAQGVILDDDLGRESGGQTGGAEDLQVNLTQMVGGNEPQATGGEFTSSAVTFSSAGVAGMSEQTPAPISDIKAEAAAEGTIIAPGLVNNGAAGIGSYAAKNPNLIAAATGSATIPGQGQGQALGLAAMAQSLIGQSSPADSGRGNAFGAGAGGQGGQAPQAAPQDVPQGPPGEGGQVPPADAAQVEPQAAVDQQADIYAELLERVMRGGGIHATESPRPMMHGLQFALMQERMRFDAEAANLLPVIQREELVLAKGA